MSISSNRDTSTYASAVSVRCYGKGLLIVENHLNIFKRKCMRPPGESFKYSRCAVIYLYCKSVSKSRLFTKAHDSHIGSPRSPTHHLCKKCWTGKLDNMTHTNVESVEPNNARPTARREPMSWQSLKDDNVYSTFQPPMGFQDPNDKQTRTGKIQNMEDTDWRSEVNLSDGQNTCRAKFLNMFSEFQYMWNEHLGRIKAAKHRIK